MALMVAEAPQYLLDLLVAMLKVQAVSSIVARECLRAAA